MSGAKRIAIVFRNLSSLSGTPNTVFDHARYLSRLGHRVDLIAEKIDRSRIDGERIGVSRIPRLPILKRRRWTWFSEMADRRVRSGYAFVAGHGHHTVQDVISLHNCARLSEIKTRGPEQARPDPLTLLQDRIFSEQRFELCIANSRLMRDELAERYRVPPEKIRVIYPGYDPERFDLEGRARYRGAVRERLGVGEEHCLIGVVTSGAFEKRGVDLAVAAFAALPASIRDAARMIVIGNTSRGRDYRALVARHGLERQVMLLPAMPEVEQYYHALDIYVHPARFEEFGQTVQEAMACGLPVVTNRQVGATELLPEALYARVPRTSTVPELVSQLERLIEDESERRAWARHGREAVAGNCRRVNFERTLGVYREAGL